MPSISNIKVRQIIASHFDAQTMTDTRRNLLITMFSDLISSGLYDELETLNIFRTGHADNAKNCYTFFGGIQTINCTFTANSEVRPSNVNGDFNTRFRPTSFNRKANQNDIIVGVRVSTHSGTGSLFGALDATAGLLLEKSATSTMRYYVNDLSLRSVTHTMQNNSLYCVARNGTTRYLLQNAGTVLDTHTQASTGTTTTLQGMHIGANTAPAGNPVGRFDCGFVMKFAAKYSSFDLSSFYNITEACFTNW